MFQPLVLNPADKLHGQLVCHGVHQKRRLAVLHKGEHGASVHEVRKDKVEQ